MLISLAISAGFTLLANAIDKGYNDAANCMNQTATYAGNKGKGQGQGKPINPCP